MGIDALTRNASNKMDVPTTREEWDAWVSATATRNFVLGNPLIDWLERHGAEADFHRDTDLPDYDERIDFTQFIMGKGVDFEAAIAAHHDGALLAFIFVEVTGFVAWLALWQFRRLARPAAWTSPAVLLLAVVTLVLMAGAAGVGGEIRHPEIRMDEAVIAPAGWITAESVQGFVTAVPWVWPAGETLHFIDMS